MKPFPEEVVAQVALLRSQGVSRAEVAQRLGLRESQVKNIQSKLKLVAPREASIQNAVAGRLAADPGLEKMRAARTSESFARQRATVAATWASPELRRQAGERSVDRWSALSPEDRTSFRGRDLRQIADGLGMRVQLGDDDPIPTERRGLQVTCHCGRSFQTRAYDFLYGKVRSCGCIKSHAEGEISTFLQGLGFRVEERVRTLVAPLEIDIYLPDQKVAIEYCGVYYHSDLFKPEEARTRHIHKLQECEKIGVRLITIFSDEWISRKEIVKAYLTSICCPERNQSVGARKCGLVELEADEGRAFLDRHHLQGSGVETRLWGLKHSGQLVGVMGWRHRGGGRWELSRFALRQGVSVLGGFRRLLSTSVASLRPSSVVSFSDRRWSVGGVYLRAGFRQAAVLPPAYWYVKEGSDKVRLHRFSFRKKHLGVGTETTERAEMERRGFRRIWDCGLVRWELDFSNRGR